MVKKKSNISFFSTLVQNIKDEPSSGEYHLIDNEYFAAFDSPDDIQEFHEKINENSSNITDDCDNDMDMKTFSQQYLIDLPEQIADLSQNNSNQQETTTTMNSNKRQRRNIRDLPQSSHFIFMSDDDNGNIFDSLKEKKSSRSNRIAYEDMSSILLTLDVKQKRKKHIARTDQQEPTIGIELAEPSTIKNEPIEQLVISHVVEAKEEPVELNVIPTGPMGFGTSEFTGDLDDFVQNIHRSCSTNVSISDPLLSRPKRIRKRKRLYIEETESIIKPKRIRKKRLQINPTPMTLLTDAEIELQFGERLSPTVKSEHNEEVLQENFAIEPEPIYETPIEKARAKLINALGRGHGPDTYLLKIRSRESKMIEVELAIYGTADWHAHRTKILLKIEEALRGLRVSWTKIDIRVDDFDIQICTSPNTVSAVPPTNLSNTNSSWFLKTLSESGPLIVHIHDRRYPQQRLFIKCSCPQCSPNETSLPVIVSVSPGKYSNHHRSPPTILRKKSQLSNSAISSLCNIDTTFFKDLINQYGTNTISSVTQCVLDLALIVSVHSSLSSLRNSVNDYHDKYQQIIDPLEYTSNEKENFGFNQPDILTFYQNIKQNKANIRNAQSMKSIIFNPAPQSSNVIKTTTLILPKPPPTNRHSLVINRFNKRQRHQSLNNEHKQQAHFTPIIELKPILGGSTTLDEYNKDEPIKKVTKIISTNVIQKDSQRINTITTKEITPRVIRLSITKPSTTTTNPIRLVTPTPPPPPPLVPKQINIIKPLSTSSTAPPIKLTNPILISNRSQPPSTK